MLGRFSPRNPAADDSPTFTTRKDAVTWAADNWGLRGYETGDTDEDEGRTWQQGGWWIVDDQPLPEFDKVPSRNVS